MKAPYLSPLTYQLLIMIGVETSVMVMSVNKTFFTSPPWLPNVLPSKMAGPVFMRSPLVVPVKVQFLTVKPSSPALVWLPTEMPWPLPMVQFAMVMSLQ